MACSHCIGPGLGQGTGNNGFPYYTMYFTHYTGTGNHCFLLYEPLVRIGGRGPRPGGPCMVRVGPGLGDLVW